ncbi:MAG: NgoFVII family restriction endonuclease [Cryobacterium sp.]|nr:NgoFVII family restriction endonuclease [Cryobacterium sp.]
MEVLYSNLKPLKVEGAGTYGKKFVDALWGSSEAIMVVAYVSEDSVVDLGRLISESEEIQKFDLVVGMARFDGMTFGQMSALTSLDAQLIEQELGRVHVVKAIPVHAKISGFMAGDGHRALVGSSNLSGLISSFRQYEVDIFFDESPSAEKLYEFACEVRDKVSVPLDQAKEFVKLREPDSEILLGVSGVTTAESDVEILMTTVKFSIPLKVTAKSNLNAFLGKGRAHNGREIPRSWYEIELIVPKSITQKEGYPQAGTPSSTFTVITDDRLQFKCSVQGDYSKNFRSSGDLKILGKWIKSRLEAAMVLEPGHAITEETLSKYGRNDLTFVKLEGDNLWYLDFSVDNG